MNRRNLSQMKRKQMNVSCAALRSTVHRRWSRFLCASLCAASLVVSFSAFGLRAKAQQTASHNFSKENARAVRPWVRDGVVYEIFPRVFSAEGNFNGVTARLDELKRLGATILWLMQIRTIGWEMKQGKIGRL